MNIFNNVRNVIEKAKGLKAKELESYKFTLFFVIIADLFGIYWYLKMKSLGMAIMIFSMMALSVILILERNLPIETKKEEIKMPEEIEKKKEEKEEKEEKKEEKKENTDEDSLGLGDGVDLGLGSSEEYNKRLSNALGGDL